MHKYSKPHYTTYTNIGIIPTACNLDPSIPINMVQEVPKSFLDLNSKLSVHK